MKYLISVIVLASSGTCSVGGTTKIPPSPAEQAQAQERAEIVEPPAASKSDPLAIITPECSALSEVCADCGEVEQMRRKIEYKKCVPVCSAYVDQADALTDLSAEALGELQQREACGKGEETCGPADEIRCEYMIGYVTSGALFRDNWANEPPADDALGRAFVDGLVSPVLDHHSRVLRWARDNEIAPAPLMARGGDLFGLMARDLVAEISTRLAAAQDPSAPQISRLIELARYPGDPSTFEQRRKDAERSLRPR